MRESYTTEGKLLNQLLEVVTRTVQEHRTNRVAFWIFRNHAVCSVSREAVEQNQIYIFKEDGRAELRDYSAPDGGTVDRNGTFPQTLVYSFSGTYMLVGDLLRITFTDVQINDPGGTLPLLRDKVVNIRIANNELIMEETDGDRTYVRL